MKKIIFSFLLSSLTVSASEIKELRNIRPFGGISYSISKGDCDFKIEGEAENDFVKARAVSSCYGLKKEIKSLAFLTTFSHNHYSEMIEHSVLKNARPSALKESNLSTYLLFNPFIFSKRLQNFNFLKIGVGLELDLFGLRKEKEENYSKHALRGGISFICGASGNNFSVIASVSIKEMARAFQIINKESIFNFDYIISASELNIFSYRAIIHPSKF